MSHALKPSQMLRAEIEILMRERELLLCAAGAAAALVANLDATALPRRAIAPAERLAASLNRMDTDTLSDALESGAVALSMAPSPHWQ